jgi:hypothetical protein
VCSLDSDQVLQLSFTGELVGVFASVASPRGLAALPDLDPPQVAVCSGGELNQVLFFETTEGLDGGSLQEGDALGNVAILRGDDDDYSVFVPISIERVGTDEMLIVAAGFDQYGLSTFKEVCLVCIPGTACAHDVLNVLRFADYGVDPSVADVPSLDSYFLVSNYMRAVFKCPYEESVSSLYDVELLCEEFINVDFLDEDAGSDQYPIEYSILVDETQKLVIVSDSCE